MTRSYLNFEAVVSNLAWWAGPGASTEDLERQAECVYGRCSLFLFLHTSPFPSAAELGLWTISIQKGFVFPEAIIN